MSCFAETQFCFAYLISAKPRRNLIWRTAKQNWGRWIRTTADGSKGRCATATQFPKSFAPLLELGVVKVNWIRDVNNPSLVLLANPCEQISLVLIPIEPA